MNKKRAVIFMCAIAFVILSAFVIAHFKDHSELQLDAKNSFLSDWYIEGDTVYCRYRLQVVSQAKAGVAFKITAFSEADYRSGLIASAELSLAEPEVLQIAAHETQKAFDVVLSAPRGQGEAKHDRLLPEKMVFHTIEITD